MRIPRRKIELVKLPDCLVGGFWSQESLGGNLPLATFEWQVPIGITIKILVMTCDVKSPHDPSKDQDLPFMRSWVELEIAIQREIFKRIWGKWMKG
jgi:hypothetical protein